MSNDIARRAPGGYAPKSVHPEPWDTMKDQASVVAKSGLAPKSVATPEKVLVIALKGRELGMPMMHALSHIHIIEGRPTLSAEAMLALVQRAGHKVRVKEVSAERCVLEGVRRDDPDYPVTIEWTMEDAKRAGVANKDNWKRHPRAMLRSRAVSELCRTAFADILSGASYTPEELGVVVDGDGEIVDSPPERVHPEPAQDVEEAEVVEEGSDGEADLDAYLDRISEAHDRLPDHSRAPIGTVLEYVGDDMRKARTVLARLNRDYEAAVERGEVLEERAS